MILPGPSDLVTPVGGVTPSGATDTDNLLETDPIAAELVLMAQRRVASQLGLAARRVRVVEVTAYEWTDSSLGCPVSGQTYVPVEVVGYRIVLSAGDSEYIFHTDADQILPCAAENEVLPD